MNAQAGQGIVEYALVIFIVAITVIALFLVLGDSILNFVTSVYNTFQSVASFASRV